LKWPNTFDERLRHWVILRRNLSSDPATALQHINDWWLQAPWSANYLHWDDRADWPDPWELLSDNIYCDIARGLGMLYTVIIADVASDARLVSCDLGNLVLVESGKYILNYQESMTVNTNLEQFKIQQQFTPVDVFKRIK
jgi:hypothetical protein